jgi:hypothetical protein
MKKTLISRQELSKWVPVAMDTHSTVEVMLDYNNGNGGGKVVSLT